jgi:hypothetical protein
MSYVGEYQEPPLLQPHNEGDPYLREYRVVRHFPTLRNVVTRTAYMDRPRTPLDLDKHGKPKRRQPPVGPVDPPRMCPMIGGMTRWYGASAHRMPKLDGTTLRKFPKTEQAIQNDFKRSVLQEKGPLSNFHESLIAEKMIMTAEKLKKERAGLRKTPQALQKEARLNDPDVRKRVLAKLEYLAKDFDTLRFGARETMSGFSGRKMVPKEFREQLRRAFNLHLSEEEVRALMDEVDVNKDGYLECHEFILHFFKLAFDARAAERTVELEEIFRRQQIEAVKEKAARAEDKARNYAILDTPYTQEDLDDGIRRLTQIAHWWDFGGYRDKIFIDPFFSHLTPLQFQRQLLQSFNMKTTNAQACALCKHFDTNGNGTVDGPEFLRGFFKMQQRFHLEEKERLERDNEARRQKQPVDFRHPTAILGR